MKITTLVAFLSALAGQAAAHPTVSPVNSNVAKRASCTNTATSRDCWGDYSIDTNWYDVTPDTGVTREYWLSVVNTTLAPDVSIRMKLSLAAHLLTYIRDSNDGP